jgi:hypothetical protein
MEDSVLYAAGERAADKPSAGPGSTWLAGTLYGSFNQPNHCKVHGTSWLSTQEPKGHYGTIKN